MEDLAKAILIAAELREKSYNKKKMDYDVSFYKAADTAADIVGFDKTGTWPIQALLMSHWNEAIDWANQVTDGVEMKEWTKEEVEECFRKFGSCTVTFTKADGTKRVMNCTRNLEKIPVSDHPSNDNHRAPAEGTFPVYEFNVGWRSFRFDRLLNIEQFTE